MKIKKNLERLLLCALLCAVVISARASILFLRAAPRDDHSVRDALYASPQISTLREEFDQFIRGNFGSIDPVRPGSVLKRSHQGGKAKAELHSVPTDAVLPIYFNEMGAVTGLFEKVERHHFDLYEAGDVGYLEFFYAANGGLELIYFYPRFDKDFVPLKSTNDLAARLTWEKVKLDSLKKWVNENVPAPKLYTNQPPQKPVRR